MIFRSRADIAGRWDAARLPLASASNSVPSSPRWNSQRRIMSDLALMPITSSFYATAG
jgi:hypothetical protein